MCLVIVVIAVVKIVKRKRKPVGHYMLTHGDAVQLDALGEDAPLANLAGTCIFIIIYCYFILFL